MLNLIRRFGVVAAIVALALPMAVSIAQDNAPDIDADWKAIEEGIEKVNNAFRGGREAGIAELEVLNGEVEKFLETHGAEGNEERVTECLGLYAQCCQLLETWENVEGLVEPIIAREGSDDLKALGLLMKGSAYINTGKEEDAFKVADELAEVSNDHAANLLNDLGNHYLDAGNEEGLNRVIEKLKDVMPELAEALAAKAQIMPGKEAPTWELPNVKSPDENLKLEDFRGKLVLMDFWATWCGPCKSLMAQELKPLYDMYKDEEGFELIGIGCWEEDINAEAKFAEENDYHWTKVFDGEGAIATQYGVEGIPFLCLVDEEGKILIVGSGWAVIEDIKALLAERFGSADEGSEGEGSGDDR